MFGKLILVFWVALAAAATFADASTPRGGWVCRPAQELEIPFKVDVRYVEIKGKGRHVMRVIADGEKLIHEENAAFGELPDRLIYRGESELASAELMIASIQDLRDPKIPSLLNIERIHQGLGTRFPIASLIDLLCTRTRTQ